MLVLLLADVHRQQQFVIFHVDLFQRQRGSYIVDPGHPLLRTELLEARDDTDLSQEAVASGQDGQQVLAKLPPHSPHDLDLFDVEIPLVPDHLQAVRVEVLIPGAVELVDLFHGKAQQCFSIQH